MGSPSPSPLRPGGGRGQRQSYPLSPPSRRRARARAVLPPLPSSPEEGGGKGSPTSSPLRPVFEDSVKDSVTPLIYNEELRPKVPGNENSRIALTNNLDFYNNIIPFLALI